MRHLKMVFVIGIVLVLVALGVSLVSNNKEEVSLTILNYVLEPLPMWKFTLFTFVLGAGFSALFFMVQMVLLETKNLRLRRKLARLEQNAGPEFVESSDSTNEKRPSALPVKEPTILQEEEASKGSS